MCGIVGAWHPHATARIDAAVAALAHRGPDDHGVYRASDVVLGHTRLAIQDLSPAGHQPMATRDGTVVLVFNGEIYNFRELREGLVAQGIEFRGHSDTEVVLELYRREGLDMLARLNGIFALAIHDLRSGDLLLARDALGVKPLYVQQDAEGLAFSSEIKALRTLLPDAALTLDPASLERYLAYLWCPGEGTPVREIRKLEPGTWLRVRNGQVIEQQRWYRLPVQRGVHGSARPAPEELAETLRRAVHRQLVSDVPVGAFLSGGLDSSAVVAMAREVVPDLRCFTIESRGGRDTGDVDDLPYARRVAEHLHVPLDVVDVDADAMATELQAMVVQLDEPLADPAPLNVLHIARLARAQGIKVLLSGAGGDDLFTGYRRHVALQAERAWAWWPRPARRLLSSLASRTDQRGALGRRIGKAFAHAGEDAETRLAAYFAWMDTPTLRALYTPQMRAAVEEQRPDQPLREFLTAIPAETSALERMLGLEQRFFLADHNLVYTDKMSMASGVEVRVPFLDLELVEFAATLDDAVKQKGREGKWLLKRAMEPYLPHDVIYRPKTGFGAPLRRWMRHDLRPLLGDLLSEEALRRRGLFDAGAVQRLIADNDAGRKDAAYVLLSLLCIEIWCRHFLDGTPSPSRSA